VVVLAVGIFLLATLGIVWCALQGLRFLGMALNPRRPVNQRRLRGMLAAVFALGLFGSATAGYLGIVMLMYYAGSQPRPDPPRP
jgi:hypothetical protein